MCGHKCPATCGEPCVSRCTRPCHLGCTHGTCCRLCCEECVACREPCATLCVSGCSDRKCDHLCHEVCDAQPCFEACPRYVCAEHSCSGLCGDLCHPCFICKESSAVCLLSGRRFSEKTGLDMLVQLTCGHTVFEDAFLQYLE